MKDKNDFRFHFKIIGDPIENVKLVYTSPNEALISYPSPNRSRGNHSGFEFEDEFGTRKKSFRIWRDRSAWLFESVGERSDLCVDDREVKGHEPVAFNPGDIICIGEMAWTVIPSDWLFIQQGSLMLFGPFHTKTSYALHHCGISIIGLLKAINTSEQKSIPLRLKLSLAEYADPLDITVSAIEPRSSVSLGTPDLRLSVERLEKQTQLTQTSIHVYVDEKLLPEAEKHIMILGAWDWPWNNEYRKTIAAFVPHQHEAVRQIVLDARPYLKTMAGTDSFTDLLRSGQKDSEKLAVQALYCCLCEEYHILYENPKASRIPDTREIYQTVLSPDRIIPNLTKKQGKGTCLDLSLLFAACIEHIDLFPLLFFSTDSDHAIRHTFAGCWISSIPGPKPIIDESSELILELEKGHVLILECTGFSKRDGKKMSWEESVRNGRDQLFQEDFLFAVDIGNLRQEPHEIYPIQWNLDPVVSQAYYESKCFARRHRKRVMELSSLLYGLLATYGETTELIFKSMQLDINETLKKIDQIVGTGKSLAEPRASKNYLLTQKLAEYYARDSGPSPVREHDVFWALIDICEKSKAFL